MSGVARVVGAVAAVAAVAFVLSRGGPKKEEKPLLDPVHSAQELPKPAPQVPWNPALCPPLDEPPDTPAVSDITFTGTCNFHHRGPVQCNALGDDFYAVVHRKLKNGAPADLYINVEFFTGPGAYDKKVEVLFMIQDGLSFYRWSNLQASVKLGGKGAVPTFVDLVPHTLTAESGTVTSGSLAVSGNMTCLVR